jgi:predicted DNA-binding transcriptional regulator AlpA
MSEDNRGRPGTSGQPCTGPTTSKTKANPITYDHGRVFGGLLFASHRDKGLFIREDKGGARLRWLKEHPDRWVELRNVEQETSSTQTRAESETPVQEISAETTSQVSAPDAQNGAKVADAADSNKVAVDPPSPQQHPVLNVEPLAPCNAPNAPGAQDEIMIGSKRYVSADRFAAMRGIARRSLTRLCTQGKAPPKRKIGNKVWFEID